MSSTNTPSILLFGATGLIGSYILDALIAAKDVLRYTSLSIFTSPATLSAKAELIEKLKEKGVRVLVGDITNGNDVTAAYEGINTVISAVGRDAIPAQIQLIDLAVQSPTVNRFFPSEYGTDVEYGPQSLHEKPHQAKLQVRAHLSATAIRGEDLAYTYVVTGPFAELYVGPGVAAEQRGGTFDVRGKKAQLLGDGTKKLSLTTMPDVGKLVVNALLHPETSRNVALKVNSFTTTPNEILAEYVRQTGGDPWDVAYTSLDKLKELEQQAWNEQKPYAVLLTLRRIWTEGGTLYKKRDNELIGDPATETLEDVVKRAIEQA